MHQQCNRKRRRNNENEEENNDNGHDPKGQKASGGDNEIMKMMRTKRFRMFIHQILQQGNDDNANDPKGLKASGGKEKESGGDKRLAHLGSIVVKFCKTERKVLSIWSESKI